MIDCRKHPENLWYFEIHKPGNIVRPIVDYTRSIGYNTSTALVDILVPHVGQTKHHVEILNTLLVTWHKST